MTHEQKPESAALPGLAYFSELITLKRGARSLRDVAPEIGISVATISRIESGKTPDLITFATLCRWLEMSPDVFLARYEPGKPPIKIEQKPESAEFRTREAHRRSVAQAWQDEGMGQLYAEALADAELSEAEARGAAEREARGFEEAKDEGANYVLTSLALLFGRDGSEIRDGSETWEGDVNATLEGILKAAGLIDDEGDFLDLAALKERSADPGAAEQRRQDAEASANDTKEFVEAMDELLKAASDLLEDAYRETALPATEAEHLQEIRFLGQEHFGKAFAAIEKAKKRLTARDEQKREMIAAKLTRPANVAALEARVKELEGEHKAWSDAAANALIWLENGRQANARDELKAAQRRAAAIRKGGEHG